MLVVSQQLVAVYAQKCLLVYKHSHTDYKMLTCLMFLNVSRFWVRESSLHVTNTTYSGLQEHRTIVYTATGQKAKPKVHLSTESTSYRKFKQNTRSMQKENRGAQVENSSIAWRSTNRTSETTGDHS
jgi:hypothetical protein